MWHFTSPFQRWIYEREIDTILENLVQISEHIFKHFKVIVQIQPNTPFFPHETLEASKTLQLY